MFEFIYGVLVGVGSTLILLQFVVWLGDRKRRGTNELNMWMGQRTEEKPSFGVGLFVDQGSKEAKPCLPSPRNKDVGPSE